MSEHQASRTLLKSPPELWAECSDAQSLARHLDDFGEITITRLEPEQAVAWEGERISGTVKLEASGWGTKVTLTATAPEAGRPDRPASESVAVQPAQSAPGSDLAGADPACVQPPAHPKPERMGFIGRIRYLLSAPTAPPAEPEAPPEPSPGRAAAVGSAPTGPPQAEAVLSAALESLGKAHHRPFSRG
jgi:hypothetical protein